MDYLLEENTNKIMDFIKKAKENDIILYTSEWTIYEAIPILLEECYCKSLQKQGIKSFRRIHRKVTRGKIPISIRKKLIPKIESLHKIFNLINFNDLPPVVHQNAQKIALTSSFSTFDALHIAIAKYLSEYGNFDVDGNPITSRCYIVTSNVSDFSLSRFKAEIRSFAQNLIPIRPKEALDVL